MNWVVIAWAAAAAACLTLAAMQFAVWWKDRAAWAGLAFSVSAASVAAIAACELSMMHAPTVGSFAAAGRWIHVPIFFLNAGIVGFVWFYFGTGRAWLGIASCGVRLVGLILNFIAGANLEYLEIASLRDMEFLGGRVAVIASAVHNPLARVSEISSMLVLVFVADAALSLWRRGGRDDRRRAVVVGGSMVFFILVAAGHAALVHAGVVRSPLMVTFAFLPILAAMGHELSEDLFRTVRVTRELEASQLALRESEKRMELAAVATGLGFWIWDIPGDEIWATDKARALFGFDRSERVNLDAFLARLHPEDREGVVVSVARALAGGGVYENEHRVASPGGGPMRWIAARGSVEFDGAGRPARMLGVSQDVTRQKQAERQLEQQRGELAHISRAVVLGELSGSLAHELNQPLAAILSNAQAAQRFLAKDPPDLAEVREILSDIVTEDRRAGEVIRRLRALLKGGEPRREPLAVGDVIEEVLALARSDLIARGVAVHRDFAVGLPPLFGDRVQLQQVLLNLILNGCDAMAETPPGGRALTVATARDGAMVRASVADRGCGLPDGDAERIFQPFFTTKSHGLGMGLAICRSIVAAHGGRIWAEPDPDRGAVFHVALPVSGEVAL